MSSVFEPLAFSFGFLLSVFLSFPLPPPQRTAPIQLVPPSSPRIPINSSHTLLRQGRRRSRGFIIPMPMKRLLGRRRRSLLLPLNNLNRLHSRWLRWRKDLLWWTTATTAGRSRGLRRRRRGSQTRHWGRTLVHSGRGMSMSGTRRCELRRERWEVERRVACVWMVVAPMLV